VSRRARRYRHYFLFDATGAAHAAHAQRGALSRGVLRAIAYEARGGARMSAPARRPPINAKKTHSLASRKKAMVLRPPRCGVTLLWLTKAPGAALLAHREARRQVLVSALTMLPRRYAL